MFKRHRNAILRILVISIAVITTGISQFSCRTGSDNAATKDHLRPSERLIDTQWVTETQSMAEEVKASAFNLVGAAGTATSDRAVGYINQVHTLFVALKEQLQILELMRSRRLRIEEGIVVNLNDQTTRGGTVFGVNSVMEVMASMEANLGRLRSLTGSLVDGSNAERGRAISEVSSLAGQLDGLADKLVAQINTWSDQPGGGGGDGGSDGDQGGTARSFCSDCFRRLRGGGQIPNGFIIIEVGNPILREVNLSRSCPQKRNEEPRCLNQDEPADLSFFNKWSTDHATFALVARAGDDRHPGRLLNREGFESLCQALGPGWQFPEFPTRDDALAKFRQFETNFGSGNYVVKAGGNVGFVFCYNNSCDHSVFGHSDNYGTNIVCMKRN